MTTTSTIYVDRDEASTILKVSTRTVDRYIRKHKFKTRKDGRRVLMKRADIDKLIQEQIGQFIDEKNAKLDNKISEQKAVQNTTSITVKDVKVEAVKKQTKDEKAAKEEAVYKNLYTEAKKELKEKQERLDAATYRVGQLESQVKTMVPMLEFSKKEKELKEVKGVIEQKEIDKLQVVNKMENKLKNERMAKWVYLSLVGMLLVLEPILFLFWAFS